MAKTSVSRDTGAYGLQVNHKQLRDNLMVNWRNGKSSTMIWGPVGVGKSQSQYELAELLAQSSMREFKCLNRLSPSDYESIIAHPEKYFLFVDKRLGSMDMTDISGTPYQDKERMWTRWLPEMFVVMLSRPESMGIIFLDEFNMAPTSVQNVAQQLILDKCVGDTPINKNGVMIICAGNRGDMDRTLTFDMTAAMSNRLLHYELIPPTSTEWVFNYMMPRGGNPYVTSYIAWDGGGKNLFTFDPDHDTKTFATPRAWERISHMIEGVDDMSMVEGIVTANVGMGIAIEFMAYMKLKGKIDVDRALNGTDKIMPPHYGIDEIYALIGGITERYKNHLSDKDKTKTILKKVAEMCNADRIPNEMQVFLLQSIKYSDGKDGREFMKITPEIREFTDMKMQKKIRNLLSDN